MKRTIVLVVGSGGDSRRQYLIELQRHYSTVIVLESTSSGMSSYPENVIVHWLSELSKNKIDEFLTHFSSCDSIKRVTTIFEPCILAVAYIREKLNLPGLHMREALLFRSKRKMYEFLVSNNIRIPSYLSISNIALDSETLNFIKTNEEIVVKPDSGYANLGVRRIDSKVMSEPEILGIFENAKKDLESNQYSSSDFSSPGSSWILSSFIRGKEVEVDIYANSKSILFYGVHEKTVIKIDGDKIEENNAITPPLTLSEKENIALREQCDKIIKSLRDFIHEPCGNELFHVYVEFIIDEDGTPFCLEMADRIGGGYIPYSFLTANNIDLFKAAASCCSQKGIKNLTKDEIFESVYWQLIYSPISGIFKGFKNLECATNMKFLSISKVDEYKVNVPHTDYVASVAFQGGTPKETSRIATSELGRIKLVIEDNSGTLFEFDIPTVDNPVPDNSK